MDPNTAIRVGQLGAGFGFVVGLLLLRVGRNLRPIIKAIVAGALTALTMLSWVSTSQGIHARDQLSDAWFAAMLTALLPIASLSFRWWKDKRPFRIASWIGVVLSIYGVANSVITMSTGVRLSSKRIDVDGSTALVATTVASPRISQQVVFLEVRRAFDGISAFERAKTKSYVEGITAPFSEIDFKAEFSGQDITLTMHHGGSMLREVKLANR